MSACQRERCAVVVERCSGPGRGCVARFAGGGEPSRGVGGIGGTVVIRSVATVAGGGQ